MNREKHTVDPPLPHNRDAEIAFLGAILLGSGGPAEIQLLESADFFLPFHRVIHRHLKRLAEEDRPTNDIVLLCDALQSANELEVAGGAAYLSQLPDGLPKISNLSHYAGIIKTKAQARSLIYQRQSDIDRLVGANGDLRDVILEIVNRPAHVGMEFGQNESALFRTAADLAEESNAPEFVVEPYLLRGAVTDLVAKIKAGKTTFALGEIVARALKKGPVVYLTEQPPASFRVALVRAQLLGRETLFILPSNAVIGLEWVAIARIAGQKCRETNAVLLAVDTLSHFARLDGDSENDSGAALACMRPLQEIAAAGPAVLTIRHERKSGGEIGDAGRGSSAFGGAADTLLALRRPEGHTRPTLRKIECVSRFEGLPTDAMYEFIDGHYEYRGTENDISEREATNTILGRALEGEPNAKTLAELIEGTGVARATAQRVIPGLISERRLQQTGKGKKGNPFRYFLPERDSAQTAHVYGQNESSPGESPTVPETPSPDVPQVAETARSAAAGFEVRQTLVSGTSA